MKLLLFFAILFLSACSSMPDSKIENSTGNNAELATLFSQDQAVRKVRPIDWDVVVAADMKRRTQVLDILKRQKLNTAQDYFHAAMIFQHVEEAEEIEVAYALSRTGLLLDPNHKKLHWLSAASWDRIMMYRELPQWYGTQFKRNDGSLRLYKTDESIISDDERTKKGLKTLEQTKIWLENRNKR